MNEFLVIGLFILVFTNIISALYCKVALRKYGYDTSYLIYSVSPFSKDLKNLKIIMKGNDEYTFLYRVYLISSIILTLFFILVLLFIVLLIFPFELISGV